MSLFRCLAILHFSLFRFLVIYKQCHSVPFRSVPCFSNETKRQDKATECTPLTSTTGIQQMERQITKQDKEYKKKWSKQHRQPACRKSYFEVGDKVLLKRRKINKWSTPHEKENYVIVGVNGSAIRARRKSDGRTITRDESKFKLLKMPRDEYWRERLLRSSNRRRQTSTARERNEGAQNDGQDDRSEAQDDKTHQPHPPQRRELPKRNRRPPPRFRDFILN